jgi:hypothetical protein
MADADDVTKETAEETAARLAAMPDDDDDGEGEEPKEGDLKAAMHAERGRRKATAKKLKEVEATLAELKPLADEYKTLLPHLPALLAGAGKKNEKPKDEGPDPELVELAQDLGLMDVNGEPDIARSAKVMARMDKRAGAVVTRETAGVRVTSATALATQLRDKAYKAVDKDGRPYAKKSAIDAVLNSLTSEQQANADQVMTALIMARGLEGPGEDAEEPLHTEGGGRAPRVDVALSGMDKAIAKLRGKSEADWKKLTGADPAATGWVVDGEA